jgi:SSS family solute:Na+ symporter
MGIVLAGFLKLLLPFLVVVPGLIYFAWRPDFLLGPWDLAKTEADKSFVTMLKQFVPAGLRGIILAALFGAIQSTLSAALTSTSSVFTMDIYKGVFRKDASDRAVVRVGILSSLVFVLVAMVAAYLIKQGAGSLFVYLQTLINFVGPPLSAIALLGALWWRINGKGAMTTVVVSFTVFFLLKWWLWGDAVLHPAPDAAAISAFWSQVATLPQSLLGGVLPAWFMTAPDWIKPYANQAAIIWALCMVVCSVASLMTPPPRPEQVTSDLVFKWSAIDFKGEVGHAWWQSVTLWWAVGVAGMFALIYIFGVLL